PRRRHQCRSRRPASGHPLRVDAVKSPRLIREAPGRLTLERRLALERHRHAADGLDDPVALLWRGDAGQRRRLYQIVPLSKDDLGAGAVAAVLAEDGAADPGRHGRQGGAARARVADAIRHAGGPGEGGVQPGLTLRQQAHAGSSTYTSSQKKPAGRVPEPALTAEMLSSSTSPAASVVAL